MVVGSTSSKRFFAMPAPSCTDTMPVSTSQIGETLTDGCGVVTESM